MGLLAKQGIADGSATSIGGLATSTDELAHQDPSVGI
jgi:hypothetical protein